MTDQGQDFVSSSGQPGAQLPEELRGWNWGAFFMTWIWAIPHRSWIAFILGLCTSLIGATVCGIMGNRWAWQNRRWDSVQHFRDTQRVWAIVGLILVASGHLLVLLWVLFVNLWYYGW